MFCVIVVPWIFETFLHILTSGPDRPTATFEIPLTVPAPKRACTHEKAASKRVPARTALYMHRPCPIALASDDAGQAISAMAPGADRSQVLHRPAGRA